MACGAVELAQEHAGSLEALRSALPDRGASAEERASTEEREQGAGRAGGGREKGKAERSTNVRCRTGEREGREGGVRQSAA
jgi:hypothetical protein